MRLANARHKAIDRVLLDMGTIQALGRDHCGYFITTSCELDQPCHLLGTSFSTTPSTNDPISSSTRSIALYIAFASLNQTIRPHTGLSRWAVEEDEY